MAGWSPWRALRERDHVTLEWRDLPRSVRGAWMPTATGATIVLATWLTQRSRRCTLSHELIHDERGIATSLLPVALAVKEELWVHRASAERLVPTLELVHLVRTMIDIDEPVTVDVVVEYFDVTPEVAYVAMAGLKSSS